MIYIGTSITLNMLGNHTDYLDSIQKHSNFRNFVLCCGFNPEKFGLSQKYPKINFKEISLEKIKTRAQNGWPENRPGFLTLQSGEFIDYLDLDNDDIVIFTDYDITMQRDFSDAELKLINNINNETFLMQWDSFPTTNLYDYFPALAPKKKPDEWQNDFSISLKEMNSFNTGVLVARVSAYRKLWSEFKKLTEKMTSYFSRHAAVQFIDCFIIQRDMKAEKMQEDMHNGQWFTGNKCNFKDGFMMFGEQKVLFAHHKFKVKVNY